jgi:hypothetical protein
MHCENAVGDHDTNYDQRQQQAGRSVPVPRHCAFHQKHQFFLVWESLAGIRALSQFASSGPAVFLRPP